METREVENKKPVTGEAVNGQKNMVNVSISQKREKSNAESQSQYNSKRSSEVF